MNDKTLFPFSYDVAWTSWNRLLKKTKLDDRDPTTNRYVLHIHCLRKFFLSQMKLEVPAVIPEALAGHEQYLDEAYQRYTVEQLGEYYKKGELKITILEAPPDLSGVKEELKEKDQQMKDMFKEMELMKQKIHLLEMESKQKDMEISIEKIKNGKK